MDDRSYDVIVIGAGFGGIATAAALQRYGVERIRLLEAGDQYGAFWTTNYDRISLHTAWHGLPDDDGDEERYAMFKPRAQLLDYFGRYAARHALPAITQFGTKVNDIARSGAQNDLPWQVHTSAGVLHARYVVVATGYCRQPCAPRFEGQAQYEGEILHSKAYRNAEPYRGKHMLVVGSGNSGAEIATELVQCGAASVSMLGYGPRWYIPIERFAELLVQAREMGAAGPAGLIALHPFTPATEEFEAQLLGFDTMLQPLAEDLSNFGLDQPDDGPFTEFNKTHRVPVIDHGAAALMRSGDIKVIKDRIAAFTPRGVSFAAAGDQEFDAVILATGFAPGLDEFVPAELLNDAASAGHGFPKTNGRCASTVHDDLYFVGFDQALMSGLALGLWGFEVAERIATVMGTFAPSMRPPELQRAPWESAA